MISMSRLAAAMLLTTTPLLIGAGAADASAPTPAAGIYSYYEFDCESPCGGSYGTWEVDFEVVNANKVVFSYLGSKCNGSRAAFYDFSGREGTSKIRNSKTSISKSFKATGKKYTITSHLKWVRAEKAQGWVRVTGPGCSGAKKKFAVSPY